MSEYRYGEPFKTRNGRVVTSTTFVHSVAIEGNPPSVTVRFESNKPWLPNQPEITTRGYERCSDCRNGAGWWHTAGWYDPVDEELGLWLDAQLAGPRGEVDQP